MVFLCVGCAVSRGLSTTLLRQLAGTNSLDNRFSLPRADWEAEPDSTLSGTHTGLQGSAGEDGWFDVLEVSSPVLAPQSLFCRGMKGRRGEQASALSLMVFCSAVQ